MEPIEQEKAADKARAEADKNEAVWEAPLQPAMPVPAFVRNAGIVNRMNVECPACRSSALNAEPP